MAKEALNLDFVSKRARVLNLWRLMGVFFSGIALGWLGATGCATHTQSGLDERLVAQAWNTIQRHYVDRRAVNPTELTYGAISGMVDSLGDTGHSTFLTPAMVKEMDRIQHGEFKGIGVEIQIKGEHPVIVAPIDGSPAQRAGLRPGDIILAVDGQNVTEWPISRVVERITGPTGTAVRLTIQDPRQNRTRQIRLVRTAIRIRDVTWAWLPGTRIAHLRISSFDQGVARDFRKALEQIVEERCRGIVLDLRNNPGGVLEEAVKVTSQFLEDGNVVLLKDSSGNVTPKAVIRGGLAPDIPLAVLINNGSASASEIVAGALEDTHRATVIGEKTFGTGTVLAPFQLADGSALLLAIEEWLTPAGRSFWHKGLEPQLTVSLPSDVTPLLPTAERDLTYQQLLASKDQQLLRALNLLNRPNMASEAFPKPLRANDLQPER